MRQLTDGRLKHSIEYLIDSIAETLQFTRNAFSRAAVVAPESKKIRDVRKAYIYTSERAKKPEDKV